MKGRIQNIYRKLQRIVSISIFNKIKFLDKAKQNFQSTIKKANVFEFTLGKKVQSEPRIPASERFNIVTKRLKIKVKFDDGGSKKAQFELSNKLYDELTEEKEQRNYNNFRIEQHDSRVRNIFISLDFKQIS